MTKCLELSSTNLNVMDPLRVLKMSSDTTNFQLKFAFYDGSNADTGKQTNKQKLPTYVNASILVLSAVSWIFP